MSISAVTTVAEVLEGFETRFAEFANGFASGEYVLWLGSGISRERMPPLPDLISDVLELLRDNIDPTNPTCRYKAALEKVLNLSSLSPESRDSLDYAVPVEDWAVKADLVRSLQEKYSQVLGVRVTDEDPDYLVWTGLDVPGTYGNPDTEPDAEHYCISILMLEGLVGSAATSNWDGLIEKAMNELSLDADRFLRVVVDPLDFRKPERRSDLIKFHGCAARAVANPSKFRQKLIARENQISAWSVQPENQYLRSKLQALLGDKNTLVVGLSVQDANMHTMFAASAQELARSWPAHPPALVLSEQSLHSRHQLALELLYSTDFDSHEDEIVASAVLGSYGKPTLMALVLWVLTEKLAALTEIATQSWDAVDAERLKSDLRSARSAFGALAAGGSQSFLDGLIRTVSQTVSRFYGLEATEGRAYTPLTSAPIQTAVLDTGFRATALGRFAVALSLLSRGHQDATWVVSVDATAGEVSVSRSGVQSRIYLVQDTRESLKLELSDDFDSDDAEAVIVQADLDVPAQTRSPQATYGRTGRGGGEGVRRLSMEELTTEASTADGLYEAFKLAGDFG